MALERSTTETAGLIPVTARAGNGALRRGWRGRLRLAALRALLAAAALALGTPALGQAPAAPTAVTVAPLARATNALEVSWTAPTGTVTGYDLQYRRTGTSSWTTGPGDVAGPSQRLAPLAANASFDVQVRARNGTTAGAWSATALGWTHAPEEEVHYSEGYARVPFDLGPGDRFRLLRPQGSTKATAAGVGGYHTLVQNAARAGLDYTSMPADRLGNGFSFTVGHRALVSTAGVDARVHTDTTWTPEDRGVPIYWWPCTGTSCQTTYRLADDYADFYDGTWANEYDPGTQPWTGSRADGTGRSGNLPGAAMVGIGGLGSAAGGPLEGGTAAAAENRPVYMLSHVYRIKPPPRDEGMFHRRVLLDTTLTVGSYDTDGDGTADRWGYAAPYWEPTVTVLLPVATPVVPGRLAGDRYWNSERQAASGDRAAYNTLSEVALLKILWTEAAEYPDEEDEEDDDEDDEEEEEEPAGPGAEYLAIPLAGAGPIDGSFRKNVAASHIGLEIGGPHRTVMVDMGNAAEAHAGERADSTGFAAAARLEEAIRGWRDAVGRTYSLRVLNLDGPDLWKAKLTPGVAFAQSITVGFGGRGVGALDNRTFSIDGVAYTVDELTVRGRPGLRALRFSTTPDLPPGLRLAVPVRADQTFGSSRQFFGSVVHYYPLEAGREGDGSDWQWPFANQVEVDENEDTVPDPLFGSTTRAVSVYLTRPRGGEYAPLVSWSATPARVREGGGTVSVSVKASLGEIGAQTEAVTVVARVGAAGDSAGWPGDYAQVAADQQATIAAGDTSATLTFDIALADDTVYEGPEHIGLAVRLERGGRVLRDGVTAVRNWAGEIAVEDDDAVEIDYWSATLEGAADLVVGEAWGSGFFAPPSSEAAIGGALAPARLRCCRGGQAADAGRRVWALGRYGDDFVLGLEGLVRGGELAPEFAGTVLRVGEAVRALDDARVVRVAGAPALAWEDARIPLGRAVAFGLSDSGAPPLSEYSTFTRKWNRAPIPDGTGAPVAVRLTGPDRPLLEAVEAVSAPQGGTADDRRYALGETIEIALAFDEAVVVAGAPTLGFMLGAAQRTASYAYHTGNRAVFAYTVVAADVDTDGIDVGPVDAAVTLGADGAIRSATGVGAVLTGLDPAPFTGHKVNGAADMPALPVLSVRDVTAGEGDGTAQVVVAASFAVAGKEMTAGYATADGTATAASDYTAASGTVTIPAGARTATVPVTLTDDAAAEGSETFTVGLSGATLRPAPVNLRSNHDVTTTNNPTANRSAQAFTTGADASYTLTRIVLNGAFASGSNKTVTLHEGSRTGSKVADFTFYTEGFGDSRLVLTPTSPTPLSGSTTYWVVTADDFGTDKWDVGTSNSDEGAAGWSIANTHERYQTGTSMWGTIDSARKLRVEGFSGTVEPERLRSNLDVTTTNNPVASRAAQAFTTGADATYPLARIVLGGEFASGSNKTVTLHEGSRTGTKVADFTFYTEGFGDSRLVLTPTSPTPLSGSTTYWVVTADDFGTDKWDVGTSNSDEGAAGWSIANTHERYQTGTSMWGTIDSARKLRVEGFIGASPVPGLTASGGTVTLLDDDALSTVSLTAPSPATGYVFENEAAGTAGAFTLTASPAPAADLPVAVAIVESGGDFVPPARESLRVTIPAGQTSVTFNPVAGDAADRPHGTVTARIDPGPGYVASGTMRTAALTVRDDDFDEAPLTFAVEPAEAVVLEGGNAIFERVVTTVADGTFTATGDLARALPGFAALRLSWGAVEHLDTEPADVSATAATITLAASEFEVSGAGLSRRVALPAVGTVADAVDEAPERFLVALEHSAGDARLVRPATHPGVAGVASALAGGGFYRAAVTVRDRALELELGTDEAGEGARIPVTLRMVPPRAGAFAVTLSSSSPRLAIEGGGRLAFAAGAAEPTGTAYAWAVDNAVVDGEEPGIVVTATPDAADVAPATATLRVFDNDPTEARGAVLWETELTVGHYDTDSTESTVERWGYAASEQTGIAAVTDKAGALDDATFDFQGVEYTVRRLTLSGGDAGAGEFVATATTGAYALPVGATPPLGEHSAHHADVHVQGSPVNLGLEVEGNGGVAAMRRLRFGADEIGPLAPRVRWDQVTQGSKVTVRLLDLGPPAYWNARVLGFLQGVGNSFRGYRLNADGTTRGRIVPDAFEPGAHTGEPVAYRVDRLWAVRGALTSDPNKLQFSTTPDLPPGTMTLLVSRWPNHPGLGGDSDAAIFHVFPLTAAAQSSTPGVDYEFVESHTSSHDTLYNGVERAILVPSAGAGATAPPPPRAVEEWSALMTVGAHTFPAGRGRHAGKTLLGHKVAIFGPLRGTQFGALDPPVYSWGGINTSLLHGDLSLLGSAGVFHFYFHRGAGPEILEFGQFRRVPHYQYAAFEENEDGDVVEVTKGTSDWWSRLGLETHGDYGTRVHWRPHADAPGGQQERMAWSPVDPGHGWSAGEEHRVRMLRVREGGRSLSASGSGVYRADGTGELTLTVGFLEGLARGVDTPVTIHEDGVTDSTLRTMTIPKGRRSVTERFAIDFGPLGLVRDDEFGVDVVGPTGFSNHKGELPLVFEPPPPAPGEVLYWSAEVSYTVQDDLRMVTVGGFHGSPIGFVGAGGTSAFGGTSGTVEPAAFRCCLGRDLQRRAAVVAAFYNAVSRDAADATEGLLLMLNGLVDGNALADEFRGTELRVRTGPAGELVLPLDAAEVITLGGERLLYLVANRCDDLCRGPVMSAMYAFSQPDKRRHVRLVGPDRPLLAGAAIVSEPRSGTPADLRYGAGETIAVELAFDKPVAVAGAPTVTFEVGAVDVAARYAYGSGTRTLGFEYVVRATDVDADGVDIAAFPGALSPGRAAIVSVAHRHEAILGRLNPGVAAGHKVDGTRTAPAAPAAVLRPVAGGEASGEVSALVLLGAPADAAQSFSYRTTAGTATAGTDFTAATGTVTVAPGARTATVRIEVLDDALDEPAETLTLTLRQGDSVVDLDSAELAIEDDDLPVVSLTAPGAGGHVYEAEAGGTDTAHHWTLALESTVPAADLGELAVNVRVAESGPGDMVPAANEGAAAVTIAAGSKTAAYTPVVADAVDEGHSRVTVTLLPGAGYALPASVADTVGSVELRDDDGALVEFSFDRARIAVAEGQSVPVRIVARTVADGTFTSAADLGRVRGAGLVGIGVQTRAGTATDDSDYTGFSSVEFFVFDEFEADPRGGLSLGESLSVATTVDAVADPDETFEVSLANAPTNTRIADPATLTVTIEEHGVLVANTAQTAAATATLSALGTVDVAQAFTTGGNPEGYAFSAASIRLAGAAADQAVPRVTLAKGGPTGAGTVALTGPDALAADGVTVFVAPADTRLDPMTTYSLVVQGSGSVKVATTASPDQDGTSLPDWGIADTGAERPRGSSGAFTERQTAMIAVHGLAGVRDIVHPRVLLDTVMTISDLGGSNSRGYLAGIGGTLADDTFVLDGTEYTVTQLWREYATDLEAYRFNSSVHVDSVTPVDGLAVTFELGTGERTVSYSEASPAPAAVAAALSAWTGQTGMMRSVRVLADRALDLWDTELSFGGVVGSGATAHNPGSGPARAGPGQGELRETAFVFDGVTYTVDRAGGAERRPAPPVRDGAGPARGRAGARRAHLGGADRRLRGRRRGGDARRGAARPSTRPTPTWTTPGRSRAATASRRV